MLSIIFNSGHPTLNGQCLYVNTISEFNLANAMYVELIMVDGNELDHIKEKFGFFPTVSANWFMSIPWNYKSKTQTWYGDLAKTILANL